MVHTGSLTLVEQLLGADIDLVFLSRRFIDNVP